MHLNLVATPPSRPADAADAPDAPDTGPIELPESGAPGTPRVRVLLIDHSRTVREGLRRALHARFDVCEESHCESAWQRIMVDPLIRAVVADVDTDGYRLLERMRTSSIARVRNVSLLMMSGDPNAMAAAMTTSLGASDFHDKSQDPSALTAKLERLVHPGCTPPLPPKVRPAPTAPTTEAAIDPPYRPPVSEVIVLRRTRSTENPALEESSMSRFDNLNRILKRLQSESPGVQAAALISEDGLMIASALSPDMDETRVGGMTATLLNLGTRAGSELRRGEVKEVIVRGEQGYAVMISAGRGALLLVLASENVPLGLIFFDMRESIKTIKDIL
jgi:predicted regulator of Ras-like GTPase activity (Roadblock/LC7/MglB family)/DNA-binding NarL/FixJ family response regulator